MYIICRNNFIFLLGHSENISSIEGDTFLLFFFFSSSGKKAKVEVGGELHVLIKEARNICAMKAGGTSDSFVKG